MIPKVIQCCWFGGGKTDLVERCRASWTRYAPDWTVCEWNEAKVGRLADLPGYDFFTAALSARKWAMASDWVRMAALYREGGVYLDCDVELVAPIDGLCAAGPWVASEWRPSGGTWLNPGGGLALERDSAVAAYMLNAYAASGFDAARDMMPWINRRLDEVLSGPDRARECPRILSPEVFAPIDPNGRCRRTDATCGIHHYAMSWAGPRRRLVRWLSWHGMRGLVKGLVRVFRAGRSARGFSSDKIIGRERDHA